MAGMVLATEDLMRGHHNLNAAGTATASPNGSG
jgi:hypothetical protein